MTATPQLSLPDRPPTAPCRRRRGLPVLLIAVATALGAAACGSSSAATPAAGPTSGQITLTVQNGDGGETALLAGYAKLNRAFEAQHPGVTIDFVTKNFTDLVNTLKLQLSGSNPPDLTQVNEGYSSMGQLISDNLLLNLNSDATKYGWNSRQSTTLLAMDGRFSADGKTMGSGPLWGVAATGAWVGLFENTKVARSLGITAAPTTFAKLQNDLAIAKRHHVIPLQYGSTDGGESAWLLATLLEAENSPQQLLNIVDAKAGTTMTSAPVLAVANTIKTWSDDGYFTPGWSAYSNSDVLSKFLAGQGLFDLNGSWNVPLPGKAAVTSKITMIPFPTVAGGTTPSGVATGDLAWSIPAKSRHAALAAEYLNFITSAQSATTWISAGNVPATTPADLQAATSAAHLTGASADAVAGWQAILTKGTALPYVDWSTPTFYTTIQSSVEELAGNKITPAAFAAKLQADYGPFVKSLG
jgi:raffinose/stachyose/melibiose transport system substrate-binding protein